MTDLALTAPLLQSQTMSGVSQTTQQQAVPSQPVPPHKNRGWLQGLSKALGRHSNLSAATLVASGFFWRLWLAHATFFNTDEAWHFSVANQDSLLAAYKASLTLAHPPLLVFILYFWRHLGTSDVMLRLPSVLAGTVFCWVFYEWLDVLFGRAVAWAGLIFATFLPPFIALSAELRQYTLMLMLSVCAAYLLERALMKSSIPMAVLSSVCLWFAMLSHYSAFLFAASLGIYAILRMSSQRPSRGVIAYWVVGQLAGVTLAAFLIITHVAKLGDLYPGDPLHRFGDFYLADVYFHPGEDHLLPFLYRATFGVFRFLCGQRTAGHLTTVLFLAGITLLFLPSTNAGKLPWARRKAWLLIAPFLLSWITVVAGLYPYGRTRQCIFLAIFGIAGVSVALAAIVKNRTAAAVAIALGIVAICHIFGTPHGRDMLAYSDQRREHMDQAVQFIRQEVSPSDVIFTDKPTTFQLQRYLCRQIPPGPDHSVKGFESFSCDGLRVVSTDLSNGSLKPEAFAEKLHAMQRDYNLNSSTTIWVVQAAWSSGLGEALRLRSQQFSSIRPLAFDRYIEVFRLPANQTSPQPGHE